LVGWQEKKVLNKMSIREVPRGRSFTPTNNGYWGAATYDDVERQALEGYKPFKPDFSSADMFGALGQANPTAAFSFLGSYLANKNNNAPVDIQSLPYFPDNTRRSWDERI
jgi:hypothetical protein